MVETITPAGCGSRRRYRLALPTGALGPAHGPEHRHACLRALALLPDAER